MLFDFLKDKSKHEDINQSTEAKDKDLDLVKTESIASFQELIKEKKLIVFDDSALSCDGFSRFITVNRILLKVYSRYKICSIPSFAFSQLGEHIRNVVQNLVNEGCFTILNLDEVCDYGSLVSCVLDIVSEKDRLCVVANKPEVQRALIGAAKRLQTFLQLYSINENGQFVTVQAVRNSRHEKNRTNNFAAFQLRTAPEIINVVPIHVSREYTTDDKLYNEKKEIIILGKQQLLNPNAVTYSTNITGISAKIYKPDKLNTFLEEKAKRMLSKNVKYTGLCWPVDILRDGSGEFVGVLVPEAKGEPLHIAIFKRAKLQLYFPNWNKRDLCELTLTILRVIQYLHKMNILMGCINPAAIRIAEKNEVYFVDTDNYQIEGFPALVYNTTFTPPEFLGQKLYLCTKENENYAVAVLTFMLLMLGKTPYTLVQGKTAEESIAAKNFAFAGETYRLPGMWRFMWSHLSYKRNNIEVSIKSLFHNTFEDGGKYNQPQTRRTVSNWIGTVLGLKEELDNPEDPESLKLYPRTFKKKKNDVFYTCSICGVSHPKFFFDKRYFDNNCICNICIDKQSEVSFTCRSCGKTFYYTYRTALFFERKKANEGWADQKHCSDCKKKVLPCIDCGEILPYYYLKHGRCRKCNDKPYKKIKCKDCPIWFTITVGEHEDLAEKGYDDPVRCPDCRKRKRHSGYN